MGKEISRRNEARKQKARAETADVLVDKLRENLTVEIIQRQEAEARVETVVRERDYYRKFAHERHEQYMDTKRKYAVACEALSHGPSRGVDELITTLAAVREEVLSNLSDNAGGIAYTGGSPEGTLLSILDILNGDSDLASIQNYSKALRQIEYLANVNYESSGEMANVMDQISDIARAINNELLE